MTQDHFESLVQRLEQEAAANPTGYRRKLGALAFLGYGYIVAALILLVGGTGLLLWIGVTLNQSAINQVVTGSSEVPDDPDTTPY